MSRFILPAWLLAALASAGGAADPLPPDLALVPRGAVWVAHVRVGDVRKDPASVLARATVLRSVPKAFAGLDAQFAPKPSTFDRVTAFSLTLPPPPPDARANAATATATSGPALPDPPAPPARKDPPPVPKAPPAPAEDYGLILRCTAPFDQAAVVAGFSKDAKPEQANGRDVFVDGAYAVGFADGSTAVFGTRPAVLAALDAGFGPREQKGEHPLAGVLKEAANPAHALTVGVADVPRFAGAFPPDDVLKGAKGGVFTVDLGADPVVKGRVKFADAGAAEKAIADALVAAKKSGEFFADRKAQARKQLAGDGPGPRPLADLPTALDGLGSVAAIEWLEGVLAAPPLVRDGDTVAFDFPVHPLFARLIAPALSWAALSSPGVAVGGRPDGLFGLFLPTGHGVDVQNNLKQLALGLHNYHDAIGKFPTSTGSDKPDKPLLSWRVALLPYVEEGDLYGKFKLDEPWDSAHNKKVVADNPMPKVFAIPGVTKPTDRVTHYQAFVGNGAAFDRAKAATFPRDFADGMSNTVLFALVKTPVEWTKPDDIAFDPKADPTKLLLALDRAGKPAAEGVFWAAFADGSVRSFKATIKPDALRGFITRAGGEVPSGED